MNTKLFIVLVILSTLLPQLEASKVVALTEKAILSMRKDYKNLFVKYYVPWCDHCKTLSPIYQNIAQAFVRQQINITLAEINCEEDFNNLECAGIYEYPTLKFYNENDVVQFDGDRTFQFLYKWLIKRVKTPYEQISLEKFRSLQNQQNKLVSVVFEGSIKSRAGEQFVSHSYYDHYNNYYYLQNLEEQANFIIHIIRPFGPTISKRVPKGQIYDFVRRYDRPTIEPLDLRSITQIFRDGYLGVMFFMDPQYEGKSKQFEMAAKIWKDKNLDRNISCVIISENHQDYFGLLEHMKMNPHEIPLVIVDEPLNAKYLFHIKTKQISVNSILNFLQRFDHGKVLSQQLESTELDHQNHFHNHTHEQNQQINQYQEDHPNHTTENDVEYQIGENGIRLKSQIKISITDNEEKILAELKNQQDVQQSTVDFNKKKEQAQKQQNSQGKRKSYLTVDL